MEDYNKVLDATEVAENANGVAAEKMTVYNESLAAAQNRLTASIQQFAQDSNLDQILAKAYDGLSKIVDILNILLNKIPILSPLIKALGVALATAFATNTLSNLAKTTTGIGSLITTIQSAIPNLQSVSLVGTAFTSALSSGLIPALQAAGSAIVTLVNPVTLAIAGFGALLVLISKIVDAFNNFKNAKENALKQSTQELEEANQNLEDTNSQIEDIQEKITEINNKDQLTLTDEAEKERLQEQLDVLIEIQKTQQEIAKQKAEEQAQDVRDVVSSKYATTDTVEGAYSKLQEREQGYESQGQSFYEYADTKVYDAESASIEQLAANIKFLEEQKKNLNATDANYQETLNKINDLETESKNKLSEKRLELLDYKKTLIDAGDTSSKEYQLIVDSINNATLAADPANLPKISLKEMINADGAEEKIKSAISDGGSSGFKELKGYADEFANKILSNKVSKEQWKEALGIPSTEDLGVNQLSVEILNLFQQMFSDIADSSDTATQGFKNQQDAIDAYKQVEDDLAQSTDILTVAYSEMNNQGHLNSSTVSSLKKQYPELTDALITQNGQVVINTDTLQTLTQAIYDNEIANITAERNKTLETINNTRQRITAYNAEITALEGLVKAGDETAEFDQNIAIQHREDAINQLNESKEAVKEANEIIDKLNKERAAGLKNNGVSGVKKSSSSKTKTDKTTKSDIVNQFKDITSKYSKDVYGAWNSQEALDAANTAYSDLLKKLTKSDKIAETAEALGISIAGMTTEQAVDYVQKTIEEQAGTVSDAYQKLLKADLDAQEKELKARQEIEKQEKEQYDKALEYIEDLEDATVSMIETGIDLLEKAGDIVFNLLGKISDRYDKQLDNLDKISDELDKQKDAFEEKIDAQKEMLKLQKEEKDNADELAEKNKSIADIDAQLMELQYDNSAEAQAKRLKLLDERAEKEKDLTDWQNDYDYNTKIDALDREKAQYEKTIEAEKKALEAQKETIEAAQKSFEDTLSKIQSGFNSFTKFLGSDIVKGLLSKALISYGGQGYQNLMFSWNRLFGTGMDSTMTNLFGNFNLAANQFGYQQGTWIGGYQDWLTGASNTQQSILNTISNALNQISVTKNQLEAGAIDLSKTFTNVVDVPAITKNLTQVKSAYGDYQSYVTNTARTTGSTLQRILQKGINTIFGSASSGADTLSNAATDSISTVTSTTVKNFGSIVKADNNSINSIATSGIKSMSVIGQSGQGILSSLGSLAQNVINTVVNSGSKLVSGVSSIIKNTSSNVGGFFSNILGMLGIGGASLSSVPAMTTANTAGLTGLSSIVAKSGIGVGAAGAGGTALGGAGLAGALGTAGIAIGGLALTAGEVAGKIYQIKKLKETLSDDTKSTGEKIAAGLWTGVSSIVPGMGIASMIWGKLLGKHHSGADYIKKQNPALDRMLGLGEDETVSILKVGEAVVPTWANNATSSSNSNSYTGSPFGSAVDSAVKSARTNSRSASESGGNSFSISMPINIQGNADAATVKALREEANNIVNKVLKTINNQTRVGGYRNIKAATV